MKKKIGSIFLSVFLMLGMGTSTAFASDGSKSSVDDLRAITVIEIFDSETGETEIYEEVVPIVALQSGERSGEGIYTVDAKVNLGDYIQSRASSTDKEENYDGVIISAGMEYANSGNKYKSTKLYGDIEFPSSLYYAEKRHWNARDTSMNDPDCCSKGICPKSDRWSYNTGCTAYEYVSTDFPPFVRYEARVYVRDMSAYRDVNVTCKLEFT